jgi:acyl carrier protein
VHDEIVEQLKHLIADDLGVNVKMADIDPEMPLLEEGLKLDSLAIVELITLSEERFGIEFGEDDLTMDSFASLCALAEAISAMRVSVAA